MFSFFTRTVLRSDGLPGCVFVPKLSFGGGPPGVCGRAHGATELHRQVPSQAEFGNEGGKAKLRPGCQAGIAVRARKWRGPFFALQNEDETRTAAPRSDLQIPPNDARREVGCRAGIAPHRTGNAARGVARTESQPDRDRNRGGSRKGVALCPNLICTFHAITQE